MRCSVEALGMGEPGVQPHRCEAVSCPPARGARLRASSAARRGATDRASNTLCVFPARSRNSIGCCEPNVTHPNIAVQDRHMRFRNVLYVEIVANLVPCQRSDGCRAKGCGSLGDQPGVVVGPIQEKMRDQAIESPTASAYPSTARRARLELRNMWSAGGPCWIRARSVRPIVLEARAG